MARFHDIAYLGGHSGCSISKLEAANLVQPSLSNLRAPAPRMTWEDDVFISWDDDRRVILHS